ncbi:putative S-adenosylmethionine-dependent methyltransferase [Corchorus capsularis]|uniref:Putative S-adenosylmethionine-dependent methyltransferase n=1 Tax=Corchorus capsularis TaxID=210143 RepID=A0A1R3JDV5_COCAP|nr:putative S-adenosylmethionine-dependent methyltransferase [Corchorus capsularis]
MLAALRCCPRIIPNPLLSNKIRPQTCLFSFSSFFSSPKSTSKNLCYSSNSILHSNGGDPSPRLLPNSPLSGLENELVGYIFGKKKPTEVAHLVWRHVLHKGDIVIDATCGNGYDTLAMLKMVADESGRGGVYAMDIQTEALESTSSLLDATVTPKELFEMSSKPVKHLADNGHLTCGIPERILRSGLKLGAIN